MPKKTLSVLMTSYNQAEYIGNALETILSQSYKPMEVLILDDASTDNSLEIIQQFVNRYPIVQPIINDKNMGVLRNINRLLQLASGDYVWEIGADDYVLPGFFEKAMYMAEQYPQAGLCASDPAHFFEDGRGFSSEHRGWSDMSSFFSPDEFAERIRGLSIPGHATIAKRSAMLEAGLFLPELKWHCDWFLWLVIAFRYGICYVPEPFAVLRIKEISYSKGRNDWPQQFEVLNNLLRLLKSPSYRDMLPYFVRGNIMSHFGDEIVRVVMGNPEHWDIETLMLIQNPLWQWNRTAADPVSAVKARSNLL